MITVNSLSGGKTSSYLAAHFPADLELFALVCIDDHNANAGSKTFTVDKYVRKLVNDKLQKYCSDQHEFLATAEDPLIIKTMLDLEQHIGREIIWLRGEGMQQISNTKVMLPNKKHRFCTTMTKIQPIFDHLFRYHELPVKMRIGFRADEADRKEKFKEKFIYATECELYADPSECPYAFLKDSLPYSRKAGAYYMHRWLEIPFRIGEFPLIDAGIEKYHVQKYWERFNIQFPKDSNCQFCFWKDPQQLRQNFDTNPSIMNAASVMEAMIGGSLHADMSMQQIKWINVQQELFTMMGSSCHGGYCTD